MSFRLNESRMAEASQVYRGCFVRLERLLQKWPQLSHIDAKPTLRDVSCGPSIAMGVIALFAADFGIVLISNIEITCRKPGSATGIRCWECDEKRKVPELELRIERLGANTAACAVCGFGGDQGGKSTCDWLVARFQAATWWSQPPV